MGGMAGMSMPGMAMMSMAAAQNSLGGEQADALENDVVESGLGQSISLKPQSSMDIAEAQFSNDAMIQ